MATSLFTKRYAIQLSVQVLELLEIQSTQLGEILVGDGFTKLNDKTVRCMTKGSMRAVYGAEQLIKVQSYPIDGVVGGLPYGARRSGDDHPTLGVQSAIEGTL